MGLIKLKPDESIQGALKYQKGKHRDSDYPDRAGSTICTLISGEALIIDEAICDEPDQLFRNAGVTVGVPFRIALRSDRGAKYYEVKRLASSPAPAEEPPSKLESQLQASISHVQQQKRAAQQPAESEVFSSRPNAATLMEISMMTAVDVCLRTQAYAHSQGAEIEFSGDAIEKIGVAFYIDARKDPLFNLRQPANGGAQPWHQ